MLATGETLLKLNDFPFIYSLLAILFISAGMDVGQNVVDNKAQFPFMFFTLSGFIASAFAITDPGGKVIRWGRRTAINKSQKEDKTKEYEISSLDTRSIDLEIEKMVSIFYLLIILLIFQAVLNLSPNFVKHLTIENNSASICNEWCAHMLGNIIPPAIMIILIIQMGIKIKELSKNIEIAGFYRYIMDKKTATVQSKDNLNRAIEQSNWRLADWWKLQIEKEIEVEEGLEEQRQKLQIETLEKQLVSYGELLTILTMARMSGADSEYYSDKRPTYILSIPEDQNRFRSAFAKGRYLFTQELNEEYANYEKNKDILRLGKDQLFENSYSDLSKMEKIAEEEYKKLKERYREITNLEI